MKSNYNNVESALEDLKQGKMIILTDDPDRENEGDLIFPAEIITPEIMNFMIRHGSGIVCLSLTQERIKQLNLSLMVPPHENRSLRGTPFVTSIEARQGITTGVSAYDRTTTIRVAIDDSAKPDDLVQPGHVFPLQAKSGGVLERAGHTEGAIDLVRLAGFKPAAVLCEIMNLDGTMASGHQLKKFAQTHQLKILSIEDLINYRLAKENLIEEETAITTLPLKDYGQFKMIVVKEKYNQKEHVVLIKDSFNTREPTWVRIHSACLTGDLFQSLKCDCHNQLHYSLKKISQQGGIIIYLNQEGRDIGLFNKIKAYALQENGMDTVQANQHLGLAIDSRKYYMAAQILRYLQIHHIRLLTNNPQKIADLKKYGIDNVEREPIPIFCNEHNQKYLSTKQDKLNHLFETTLMENVNETA